MPRREVYQRDRVKFSKAESAHRRARQPRVAPAELERLRIPENRLESLRYGTNQKCVCLNCGLICDNLSRHVSACPEKKQSSAEYKALWGFAKSTVVASATWQAEASRGKRQSLRFQEAQERNRARWQAESNEQRRRVSAARKSGQPVRRGPQRLETVLRKRGRRLPARPDRQKVPDSKILEILALDLPIAQGAKLAIFADDGGKRRHLSQTAFYRRAQTLGWNVEAVRARRKLVNRLVFELRSWLRTEKPLPTAEQIDERYAAELRSNRADSFREFTPYLSCLQTELHKHPETIRKMASRTFTRRGGENCGAVIALASKIFQRARAKSGSRGGEGLEVAAGARQLSTRQIEKGKRCEQIIAEMRKIKRMCVDSGQNIVEIQCAHPEFEAWKVREALNEEDRETFNHPRQWGPPVGYARLVLAKIYSKNEGTVKNWVKWYRQWSRSNSSAQAANQ